jgi:pyrroline-5-carboxylate reductase
MKSQIRNNFVHSSAQSSMKLYVIGGGNMAEAIINALSKSGAQSMSDVTVYDISDNRIDHLQKTYGVKACANIEDGMVDADVVFLSVKPQNVSSVAKSLAKPPKGLLLSIVAGCTIDRLKAEFRTDKIVRSMPNTPAMVLEGMTVWTATKETPKEYVEKAKILLSSIGDQIEVKDESYIDMATAVSGSGPAVSGNTEHTIQFDFLFDLLLEMLHQIRRTH